MWIEEYEFGRIVVGGKEYREDIIIFPDRVKEGWWRKEGHLLLPEDLEEVLKEKPEVLVVGTGYSGYMKVPPSTKKWIEEKGINLRIEPTPSAWKVYNQLSSSHRTVAVLHLTC